MEPRMRFQLKCICCRQVYCIIQLTIVRDDSGLCTEYSTSGLEHITTERVVQTSTHTHPHRHRSQRDFIDSVQEPGTEEDEGWGGGWTAQLPRYVVILPTHIIIWSEMSPQLIP
ncbi:hypothetical protein J6590_076620 [Homalodisca vitripennis]|nr:hypothetical protein J6590_076620 [Homalodisca vitripennis]